MMSNSTVDQVRIGFQNEAEFQPFFAIFAGVTITVALRFKGERKLMRLGPDELNWFSSEVSSALCSSIGHSVHPALWVTALLTCSRRFQQEIDENHETNYELSLEQQSVNDSAFLLLHTLDVYFRRNDPLYRDLLPHG